jgi:hypothetical protein
MKKSKASLLLAITTIFISCEGPEGPMGPEGPQGPPGETVKEIRIVVAEKMYTQGNPYWITVYYDDMDASENTSVIFVAYKNVNGVWVSIESYDLYFCCTIYASGEYGYDNKSGYAALIYDPNKDLIGKELKLLYIP